MTAEGLLAVAELAAIVIPLLVGVASLDRQQQRRRPGRKGP
jgi:hypothetical protein